MPVRPLLPVLLPVLLVALLLGLILAPGAKAEETTSTLTLDDVLHRGRFVRTLPDWRWHPARALLRREASASGGRVLLELDPTAPQTVTTRLDWGALATLVPQAGGGVRGIGRGRAPRWVPDPQGKGLVAVVNGHLVWSPGGDEPPRVLTGASTSPMANVEVSPGGAWVTFTRDHDVWSVPTGEGEPRRLTHDGSERLRNGSLDWVVPEELGLTRGAWTAPDARHVAYLQLDQEGVDVFESPAADGGARVRYPRAGGRNPRFRVGVVPIGGGETRWLDLGVPAPAYVARLAWTPRGDALLVVTFDRAQRTSRLVQAPIDGSASRVLLEERDAAWVDVPPAPTFVDGHRFLWRSHRDGTTRWYLVTLPAQPAASAAMHPLTPKGIDVPGRPALDLPTRKATYVGTRHGAMRARPYVGLAGDEAACGPPPGHHTDASFDSTGTWVVLTWSNAVTPPRRELRRVATGQVVRSFGDGWTERLRGLALAQPTVGEVAGAAGPITWRLWRSSGADGVTPRPLLVRVYGGPSSRLVVDRWESAILLTTLLTERYHVLEVDGRGTAGWGSRRERLVVGRLGLAEIEDQVAAVRHVSRRKDVDGDRVGIFGWSFGGTLACLGLLLHADVFRVGVAIAPVTDWRLYDTIYTERYLGLPQQEGPAYRASAVTTHAAGLRGRLLLLHGTNDENVHVENTRRLVEAFEAAGRTTFEVKLYPGCGHGLGGCHHDLYERLISTFEEHLQQQ